MKAGILEKKKKNLLLKKLSVVFNAHKIFDLSWVFVELRTETVYVPCIVECHIMRALLSISMVRNSTQELSALYIK